jgi:putative hydrolase of the HAD superfamily
MKIFDHVIESSKIGIRKPDPKIYEMSCKSLEVSANECIYLDDLGINLKPARTLGMTTIKVIDPHVAIAEVKEYLNWV